MNHLVASIQEVPLHECYNRVREAHSYLSKCGKEALKRMIHDETPWGIISKRIPVKLTDEGRPSNICKGEQHSLVEIINQCATMERLLDALKWAQSEKSGLKKYTVQCCHPTTSSEDEDNDLVLRSSDEKLARFEVSDIASPKDGNRKEEKSLIGLGVLKDAKGEEKMNVPQFPDARLFLVVSEQFGEAMLMRKRAWREAHCRYERAGLIEDTLIFEIQCGRK